MEKISAFFIKRKLLVTVLVTVVFLYGVTSIFQIKRDAFPEITFGKIIITTIYPGASARDVEINVTVPIERELQEVSGVKDISSASNEGYSTIIVSADDDATTDEIQQLYNDVDSAINRIDDLPANLDGPPVIRKVTSHDNPFMEIAFTGDYETLIKVLPSVERDLRKIPYVSSVDAIGLPDPEIHVLIDPAKARREYVGLKMIASAINERNLEGSGGTLESYSSEQKVVSINRYSSMDEVLDTNIRTSRDSTRFGVKIRDIAAVKTLPKNDKLMVRNNGKPGATLVLKKNANGDVIETSEKVYSYLKTMKLPDGVKWQILLDNSSLARSRLELAKNNAILGLVIVITLLFLIFDFKSAFWTAFGIPFSIVFAVIFLYASGNTINLISLVGMIVVLGMLVDDAIVMTEQYHQNTASGMDKTDAAVTAVRLMWKPILAGLTTTALAFLPLAQIGGFPGKFIWQVPFVITLALTASMIDVFLFLPSHLCHESMLKIPASRRIKKEGGIQFTVLVKVYKRILLTVIRFRYLFIPAAVAVLVFSLFLMKNFVKKDAFPQDGVESFTVQFKYQRGQSLNKTSMEIAKAEALIKKSIGNGEFLGMSSHIGTDSRDILTEIGSQENLAVIFVYLTPLNERDRNIFAIMENLKKTFDRSTVSENCRYIFEIVRLGPPMGWPVEVRVVSNDDDAREKKALELKKFLSNIKGITGIDDDHIEGKDELNIVMNYDLISRTGLSVKSVLDALRISFDGLIVSTLRDIERDMDIRLRLNSQARSNMAFIKDLPVMNNSGNLINMGEVLKIKKQKGRGEIRHFNGERTTTVFANTDRNIISGDKVYSLIEKEFNTKKWKGYIEYAGEPVEQKKIFSSLGSALLLSLASILLVMVLIFNSFGRPFIILLSLPFCLPGVVFTLLMHNHPMSMMSGGATIGLMGVVINASIVIIDILTKSEENGKPLERETVAEMTSTRLRPILLSTLTTVAGLLPTAYGIGGYDPFISQMCSTLAWGLIFGTAISLLIVPLLYMVFVHDLKLIKMRLTGR